MKQTIRVLYELVYKPPDCATVYKVKLVVVHQFHEGQTSRSTNCLRKLHCNLYPRWPLKKKRSEGQLLLKNTTNKFLTKE